MSNTAFRPAPVHRAHARARAAVLALLLATLLLVPLLFAAPAKAHDELLGSTPADGSVLAEAPARVELTFSNNPAAIGSVVLVSDADGGQWAEGDVTVLDRTVSQELAPDMPAGEYTVAWRVVSSDAHPIEGTLTFTVGAGSTEPAGAGEPGDTGAPAESPAAAESGAADPSETPAASGTTDPDDGAAPGWVIGAGVAAGAAALVVVAVMIRSRLRGDGD